MVTLLDVNVLVALAWPNHVHHARARACFDGLQDCGWATCSITQAGFVRVSSNRAAIPEARTPTEATALLGRMVALPGHRFWADDVPVTAEDVVPVERVVSYRQVTDAHLLTLAVRRGGMLATFDRGISELPPPGSDASECVLLIP